MGARHGGRQGNNNGRKGCEGCEGRENAGFDLGDCGVRTRPIELPILSRPGKSWRWMFQLGLAGRIVFCEVAGADPAKDFTLRHWTTDSGLPQHRITAMAQTTEGYLWLGTWAGVVRFDGVRFTLFNHYKRPELPSDSINALAATPDGTLWIGTHEGLVRLRDQRWERSPIPGLETGLPIWELAVDGRGALWIDTGERFGRFPDGPYAFMDHFSQCEQKLVHQADGRVLPLITDGVFQSVAAVMITPRPPGPETYCMSAIEDGAGGWWMGTVGGLYHRRAGMEWKQVPAPFQSQVITHLYRDARQTIWVGIRGAGLARVTGDAMEGVPLGSADSQPDVSGFLEDREGSLWIATDAGLFQLRPRIVQAFTRKESLPSDEIWSVSEGPDGAKWLATEKGLAVIGPKGLRALPDVSTSLARRCVLADPANVIWMDCVTADGAFYRSSLAGLRPDGSLFHGLEGVGVQALYLDHDQRLWVGTEHGVICCRDGRRIDLPGLPKCDIRFSLQGRDGGMWFGSKGAGLFHWKDGAVEQFTHREGLADDYVIALHEDSEGVLWIGTANGLSRLVPSPDSLGLSTSGTTEGNPAFARGKGQFFTFTIANGLLDNLINHIVEDDDGFLWLSCNRGIFRIARAELNAVGAGRESGLACAVFGTADGMPSSETNGEYQPAGCKDHAGRLWFPTTVGVVTIDPKNTHFNEAIPPVVIEQVQADGEVILGDEQIAGIGNLSIAGTRPNAGPVRLPPGRARVLEIRYTANGFVAPEKIRFKYRLEGHDPDWRLAESGERRLVYVNLRPGDYTFRVSACNNHGIWNPNAARLDFSVAPHFYETWAFYFACGAATVGLAGGVQSYRLAVQRRIFQLQQTQAVAEERARIARDLHDDLGASLTGIALEMEAVHRRGRAEGNQLATLASDTRVLANGLRELTWTTNPRCDNVGNLGAFLGELMERYCQAAGVGCQLELPGADDPRGVAARVRHELLVVLKETLANAAKHSGAHNMALALTVTEGEVRVVVRDDGRGFDPAVTGAGSGLRNLRERVELVGGSFEVESSGEAGTMICVRMPVEW